MRKTGYVRATGNYITKPQPAIDQPLVPSRKRIFTKRQLIIRSRKRQRVMSTSLTERFRSRFCLHLVDILFSTSYNAVMFWLYLVGGVTFVGTTLGLATGYLDAKILNISEEFGKALFKYCGIILLIDIGIAVIASLFPKRGQG